MMRLETVKTLGGYQPDVGIEDLYMWLRMTHNGYRIAVLEDVLARYRKSTGSLHHRTLFMLEHKLRIIEEYREHPQYRQAHDKAVLGSMLRAASHDKASVRAVLSCYEGSWLNAKLWRGLWRWMM